jgi:glycosyltransferase involved in cell wall biosynthesis
MTMSRGEPESTERKPKYSVVTSIYNDGDLAESFYDSVANELRLHDPAEGFEVIFVDDGSQDGSLVALHALAAKHSCIRVIALSRNFGQHPALPCGIRSSKGSTVIRLNVDLQDHPRELSKLLVICPQPAYQ